MSAGGCGGGVQLAVGHGGAGGAVKRARRPLIAPSGRRGEVDASGGKPSRPCFAVVLSGHLLPHWWAALLDGPHPQCMLGTCNACSVCVRPVGVTRGRSLRVCGVLWAIRSIPVFYSFSLSLCPTLGERSVASCAVPWPVLITDGRNGDRAPLPTGLVDERDHPLPR